MTSHLSDAGIWIGVAKFISSNGCTHTHPSLQQKKISLLSKSTHQLKNSKKNLHWWQQHMVRTLLKKILDKIDIIDTLDSRQYPYRLSKHHYPVSFSHTQNWVACAISQDQNIGIDIEKNFISDRIAKRFFHPNISSQLTTLNKQQQQSYKQLCWMLAEALLKKNQGNHLPRYLRQDYSWIVSQLLPHMTASTPCKGLLNPLVPNNHSQCVLSLSPPIYDAQQLSNLCSGLIYIPHLSVLAAY